MVYRRPSVFVSRVVYGLSVFDTRVVYGLLVFDTRVVNGLSVFDTRVVYGVCRRSRSRRQMTRACASA